ncbi:myeloid-derived growth factor-like [Watersipora subatra]|uniref:myeloid-derived growth factor-like n=1 Tax=Watersipora subatra TaxID=2589382 RepID=UPI00355C9BCA
MMPTLLSSILFLSICIPSLIATETYDFELKPAGIEQQVEHEAFGVTCRFTYSAEGGTKEHWTITMKRSKDHKDVLCVIERPDVQSYLMFEAISVHMVNADVKSGKVFKDHETKLPDDNLVVNHGTNTVSNSDSFKNEMSVLRVRATIHPHSEL